MSKLLMSGALSLSLVAAFGSSAFAASTPTPKATPKPIVVAEAAKPAPAPVPKTHTVAAGDSLSTIAAAENLESWRPLWNVNPELTDPDIIYEGQVLTVPEGPTTDRELPAAPVQQAVSYSAPRYQQRAAAAPANYSAGAGGILERIRQRESGGNYATNTGNGYYGAYQYDIGTWNNYGGYARADLAPAAVQDAKAAQTYAQRGCSPWPNTCY